MIDQNDTCYPEEMFTSSSAHLRQGPALHRAHNLAVEERCPLTCYLPYEPAIPNCLPLRSRGGIHKKKFIDTVPYRNAQTPKPCPRQMRKCYTYQVCAEASVHLTVFLFGFVHDGCEELASS